MRSESVGGLAPQHAGRTRACVTTKPELRPTLPLRLLSESDPSLSESLPGGRNLKGGDSDDCRWQWGPDSSIHMLSLKGEMAGVLDSE